MNAVVQSNVDLKAFNSMSLSVTAKHFVRVNNAAHINEALTYAHKRQLPICVLGGGSNVIFTEDYSGLLLLMVSKGIQVLSENDNEVIVRVEAGEVWDDFLRYCLKWQWYGLENLAIIPGTVGAAPIQNIGAYGQEVASCIEGVDIIYCENAKAATLSKEQCLFSYRDSIFKQQLRDKCIIAAVIFRLQKKFAANLSYKALAQALEKHEAVSAEQVRNAVIAIRESKLPSPQKLPNCGSFFKNPIVSEQQVKKLLTAYPEMPVYPQHSGEVKIAAGWLIERVGWKGKRLGAVGMYDKQALVLVNYANATYAELNKLVCNIKADVYDRFAIQLEQEPIIIGQV
jgi:UDP-N-acetylmuramate dehydrogenase